MWSLSLTALYLCLDSDNVGQDLTPFFSDSVSLGITQGLGDNHRGVWCWHYPLCHWIPNSPIEKPGWPGLFSWVIAAMPPCSQLGFLLTCTHRALGVCSGDRRTDITLNLAPTVFPLHANILERDRCPHISTTWQVLGCLGTDWFTPSHSSTWTILYFFLCLRVLRVLTVLRAWLASLKFLSPFLSQGFYA